MGPVCCPAGAGKGAGKGAGRGAGRGAGKGAGRVPIDLRDEPRLNREQK